MINKNTLRDNTKLKQKQDIYEEWIDILEKIALRRFETARTIYKNKKSQIGLAGAHHDKYGCFEEAMFNLKEEIKELLNRDIEEKVHEAQKIYHQTVLKRLNTPNVMK